MRLAAGMAGALIVLLVAGGASAGDDADWDTIVLKNGRVITGSVAREGRDYRVRRPLGSILINAQDVLRVELQHDSVDELERMQRENYALGTAEERLSYAKLLARVGSRAEARRAYLSVLRLDPTQAEANLALGRVLHQGVWKSFDQAQRDRGLVLYQGSWVTPAERVRLVAQARVEATRQAALAAAREAEAQRSRAAARAREAALALQRQKRDDEAERVALVERAARAEAQLAEARRAAAAPVVIVPRRRTYGQDRWSRQGGNSYGRHSEGRRHRSSPSRPRRARQPRQATQPRPTRQPRQPRPTQQPAKPATPVTPAKPVIAPPRIRQLPPGAK